MNNFKSYFFYILLTSFNLLIGQSINEKNAFKPNTQQEFSVKNSQVAKGVNSLLNEYGSSLDWTSAKIEMLNKNDYLLSLKIIDNSNSYDFKSIIFEYKKSQISYYFDETNKNYKSNSSNNETERIFCTWQPWQNIPDVTECRKCIFSTKSKKVVKQFRNCIKYNDIKRTDYRWVKMCDCGCCSN